ncbi:MAG TPA: glutathione S-transferase family protein [Steroidobacteraceae bacterium]|jgi:glutathione S-transferase|nr:glutathione S-transferase family protein [Steroidobacteraceae bacterium]
MLKLYHAEPVANSLKTLLSLKEKGLAFESVYIDLHRFEQHEPWFVALNPEGQVPVLEHDGQIITHTTVIGEYLEDAFPDAPSLRPHDPLGTARMRYWNKFCDEHVLNYVSMHGWHRMVSAIARSVEAGEFERLMERIPLHEQREKWRNARSGFSEADLANATRKIEVAVDKVERQLQQTAWLAGQDYTLADINFFASGGVALDRLFPTMQVAARAPHLSAWVARMLERPGVKAAFAMPDRTHVRLRTFTGEVH